MFKRVNWNTKKVIRESDEVVCVRVDEELFKEGEETRFK